MKSTTSVYIDVEVKQKLKQMGINLSELTNRVCKQIINELPTNRELALAESELKSIREQLIKLKKEEEELMVEVIRIRTSVDAETRLKQKSMEAMAESLINAGVLYDLPM